MSEICKGFFAFFLLLLQIWTAVFFLGVFTERGAWESEAHLIAAKMESQEFSEAAFLQCRKEVKEKDGEMNLYLYLPDGSVTKICQREEFHAWRIQLEQQKESVAGSAYARIDLTYGGYLAKIFPQTRIRVSAVAH